MKARLSKAVLAVTIGMFALSGCATKSLLEKDSGGNYTKTVKKTLVNDHVLAFGKPSVKLPNLPNLSLIHI